ncbi:MAG: hypothetical protein KF784_06050 [Fimbriimonadaceae bacterium]|nr:hypothetical protein [Fimbriimonadaceae bacterium]
MKAILLGALAALSFLPFASGTNAQDQPKNDLPPPTAPDQVWSIDAGNGRIRIWVVWKDEGITGLRDYYCDKMCRGKKHLLHSQCDDSCDRACEEVHRVTLPPELTSLHDLGYPNKIEDITKDFQKFGATFKGGDVEWNLREAMQKAIDKDAAKWTVKLDWRHWFNGACGGQKRRLKAHRYSGKLHYEMYREVPGPDGKIIKTTGPTGSMDMFEFKVFLDQYDASPAYTSCRCSVISEEPKEHGYIPPPSTEEVGVCMVTPQGTVQCSTNALAEMSFNVSCQNMGLALITAENPTTKPIALELYPGTVLRSDDPNFQDMLIIALIKMVLPPKPLYASALPEWIVPPAKVTARARIACMNMHKKQPEPSVKYEVGLPSDRGWAKIAGLQAKLRTEDPYDQARLWVYSDKATYEDITTKLFPAPSKGQYARALYQLKADCEIDLSGEEYKGCFDPMILGGTDAPLNTVPWLVKEVDQRDPNKLAKWVEGSGKDFADAFAKAGKAEIAFFAALTNSLAASSNPAVRASAARFILTVLPQSLQGKVAEADGLKGILGWLFSADAAEAKAALDVYEACRPTSGALYLRNLNPALPEDIRTRGAKLLGSPG